MFQYRICDGQDLCVNRHWRENVGVQACELLPDNMWPGSCMGKSGKIAFHRNRVALTTSHHLEDELTGG